MLERFSQFRLAIAAASVFILLAIVTIAYDVSPWTAIKHSAWYAFGDTDSVPIWMQSMTPFTSSSMAPTSGSRANIGPVERVESWGVSSAQVRAIMQEHNVLTDWWQDEITRVVVNDFDPEDPLLASYPGAMGLITGEVAKLIPADTLMEKWHEDRMPGSLRASGCPPTMKFSITNTLVYYNVAPRRMCDNVIGGLLWLLAVPIGIAVVGFARSRLRRAA